MTSVAAVMRRIYTADMFADLNVPSHVRTWDKATGVTTLTFAGELDPATVDAIWSRMESRHDADQQQRAALRAAAAALPEGSDLRLTICYLLGD